MFFVYSPSTPATIPRGSVQSSASEVRRVLAKETLGASSVTAPWAVSLKPRAVSARERLYLDNGDERRGRSEIRGTGTATQTSHTRPVLTESAVDPAERRTTCEPSDSTAQVSRRHFPVPTRNRSVATMRFAVTECDRCDVRKSSQRPN